MAIPICLHYHLWPFSHYHDRVQSLLQRSSAPQTLKYLLSGPSQEEIATNLVNNISNYYQLLNTYINVRLQDLWSQYPTPALQKEGKWGLQILVIWQKQHRQSRGSSSDICIYLTNIYWATTMFWACAKCKEHGGNKINIVKSFLVMLMVDREIGVRWTITHTHKHTHTHTPGLKLEEIQVCIEVRV